MRVLITNPSFDVYGGAERVIVKLANYMTGHNIKNTILTQSLSPQVRQMFTETRILVTPEPQKLLPQIIEDFDVINAHNNPAQFFHIPKRKPIVWMCNEPPLEYLHNGTLPERERFLVKNFVTKAVVADSFNQRRFFGIYGMNPTVIPYGIEFDAYQNGNPAAIIRRFNLDGSFVITHVGFMTFTKNQLGTLDIFKDVKKQIPHAKLLFAGFDKCQYRAMVENKAKAEGIADVIFAGELSQEEIRDLYAASNVVISPIQSQGGWLNVFEAIAAGRPVIVGEEMTASSMLREHQIGTVAHNPYIYDVNSQRMPRPLQHPAGQLTDFISAITNVYSSNIHDDLSGQDWVRTNLTWDNFCANMVRQLRLVIE